MELRPEVFVAMSFDPRFSERYTQVFEPAITAIQLKGVNLTPKRVDLSKSGDSIINDINDGIAHCQLVLADISTIGNDGVTGRPYRNANVMYEVGLALAARNPAEVLLVCGDQDPMIFDVSSIPHMRINFAEIGNAKQKITAALVERIGERNFIHDSRVRTALSSLSPEELNVVRMFADHPLNIAWGIQDTGTINFMLMSAIPRLLDKQMIRLHGAFDEGHPAYTWTELGYTVAQLAKSDLPVLTPDSKPPNQEPGGDGAAKSASE